ncbi:Rep family protein [Propionimicrobium lymphophilum]|uniref:Rep family protein n=1 Tax=Propionimicrobium lymphophilum TaxID=33012 RepID=UPI00041909E6|nr:Rep family protein [Propionimicrobium lymphophilum]
MSGGNKLQIFHITQQLRPELWSWVNDPKVQELAEVMLDGFDGPLSDLVSFPEDAASVSVEDCRDRANRLLSLLVLLLEQTTLWGGGYPKIVEAHGIIHNCDEQNTAKIGQPAVMEPKFPHLHATVKFDKPTFKIARIAKILGVETQFVEKPNGRIPPQGGRSGSHDAQLAYLIHAKDEDKYQYEPEQVATVAGQDYLEIQKQREAEWFLGRGKKRHKLAALSVDALLEQVLSGNITKENVLLSDELFRVYSELSDKFNRAFVVAGERKAYRAAEAMKNGDFHTAIFFLYGAAGSGKTRLANLLVDQLIESTNWSLYRAASRHSLDDWQGQEIILMDDVRASAMSASDWLTLLDPYNPNPASARYQNKLAVAPRLVIITASIDPVTFFYYARAKGDVDEALDQFIRRLMASVNVINTDGMPRYYYKRLGLLSERDELVRHRQGVDVAYRDNVHKHSDFFGKTPELTRGVVDSIKCDEPEIIARLSLDVANSSPDVIDLTESDWVEVTRVVEQSSSSHDAELRERIWREKNRWVLLPSNPSFNGYYEGFKPLEIDGSDIEFFDDDDEVDYSDLYSDYLPPDCDLAS